MIRTLIYQENQYKDLLDIVMKDINHIKVVGGHDNLDTLGKEIFFSQPDVVLMDVFDPLYKTLQQVRECKEKYPNVKIIFLTDRLELQTVLSCMKSGADGYVLRKTSLVRIREFIEDAYNGGIPFSPQIARQFFKGVTNKNPQYEALTSRETEVLRLLVDGLTYKLISSDLGITLDTVRSHIKNIYEKLHVNSKSEAVAKALREKIIFAF